MSDDWRNELATEQQKEKLRFFGCTWDDGITAGQAGDALEECRTQFPAVESAYLNERGLAGPPTEDVHVIPKPPVRPKPAEITETPFTEVTIQKAETIESSPTVAAVIPPPPEQQKNIEAPFQEATIRPAKAAAPRPSARHEGFFSGAPASGVHDSATQSWTSKGSLKFRPKQGLHPANQDSIKPQSGVVFSGTVDPDPDDLATRLFREGGQKIILSPDAARRYIADQRFKLMNPKTGKQLTATTLGASRQEYMISLHWQNAAQSAGVSRDASRQDNANLSSQTFAQRPASNQPALIPIWQSLDDLLKGWPSSDGCYWLPVKMAATLVGIITKTELTNGQSRQIANQIEWNGYCFEPDARYGGGTYDIGQTLVVFKPFAGDQINPSTAYLGAANLLRLCVLIAAADGQIDEVELDVFRQVIENQLDLTPTDHRRLQVLEKLLVQDPSSAAKTLASVAKSITAHKRLLIGKVLVRVAAADTVITKDERRALERIFKAFEIPQETLENLMFQACPQSQAEKVQTPPVSIPVKPETPEELEAELTREKEWDEWVALQERIAERQKRTLGEAALPKDETVETQPSVRHEGFFCGSDRRTPGDSTNYDGPATPEQLSELRSNGIEAGPGLKFVEANELIESCRSQEKKASHHYKMYCPVCNGQIEVSIGTVGKKRTCDHCQAEITPVFTRKSPQANIVRASIVQDSEPRRPAVELYEMYCPVCDGNIEVQQGTVGKRRSCPHCQSNITPVFIRKSPRKKPAPTHVAQDSIPFRRADVAPRQKADDTPGYYSRVTREQLDELRSLGENPTNALAYYGAAKIWIENCKTRKGFGIPKSTHPEVARGSAVSERISAPVAPPAPKQFALDMAKVHFITNETKEVVGILSDLMADEPEQTVTSPQRVEVSAPKIPAVPDDSKSTPQQSQFGGLNAAFIPILERLLTRESWAPADFNALAREFQFMPLNIRDTLNEWSDEALGDFILDGENPVFVRRELMTKEKI